MREQYIGRVNGKDKYKKIYLHRVINQTPLKMETDHINRNKLDNRKNNLRTADRSQNAANHNAHKNNITGVCGVNWYGIIGKYRAFIVRNKKRISLGYFINLEDAVAARKKGEIMYAI
jgi:hypothetical protein